ncbi:UDP-glucuronosyltransferase 2C1-like [Glandiceps talaboti]
MNNEKIQRQRTLCIEPDHGCSCCDMYSMAKPLFVLLLLYVSLLQNRGVESFKILVAPGMSVGSTYMYMEIIGRHLAEHGHQVTILVNNATSNPSVNDGASSLHFETYAYKSTGPVVADKSNKYLNGKTTLFDWLEAWLTALPECDQILGDRELLGRLQKADFDLVVANVFVICPILLVQQLSLPFVLVGNNRISPMMDGDMYNIPSNPAYVPSMGTGLTSQMSFLQRLKNVANYGSSYVLYNFYMLPHYRNLQHKYNIRPELTLHKMAEAAELFIYNTDFAFDYPRPLMPNVVLIGGIMAGPAEPLEKDLEEFMQSSGEHGVVIFSLGSYMKITGRDDKSVMILSALGRLPQRVILKGTGYPPNALGNNTKAVSWLPQNDLLGHPKTKAIIYHGGLNGVYEAIYHGVPIVGMPLYTDQYDNIPWMADKGMAVTLDVKTLTEDKLYDAVLKVVTDARYKQNAERLSRIHRDRPMSPGDTAVFWIEHVIKHGGQHLRSQAGNLNFVQYYLIDVMLFLVLVTLTVIVLIKKTCSCLYKCCRGLSDREKRKSD